MKQITVGNFDYRLEGQLYVIKKVPASLCLECGEKYIDTEVGHRMNALIAAQTFTASEQVNVIEYQ
jgi:YgiT-type zinc finger domain-containing protein